MIRIRKSNDRGHADYDWLKTSYTFSFANYDDPAHTGFRTLRVINEDHIAPGKGFPTHGHRDMEIVTYILEGALEHKDSMGTGSVIRPGEVQRISAGTGVMHSEYNPSKTEPVHLLQIWILPEKRGTEPGYEQKTFPIERRRNRLCLIASQDGRDGSVTVHQDVSLYTARLDPDAEIAHPLPDSRHAWVQVTRGGLLVNGATLDAGDGAAISEETELGLRAVGESELLLFDLA